MKKYLIPLIVLVLIIPAISAQNGAFFLRVNTQRELFRGEFWKYSIESIDVSRDCSPRQLVDVNSTTLFKVADYGNYEIVIYMHEWNNDDFATWDKFTFQGTSAVVCSDNLEGIWIIDVYLYENGILVDSMYRCWNFQVDPDGSGRAYRLRFF